jgi:hypothetical protein
MTNNMNVVIADALQYLHIAFVIFVSLGWYFIPVKYIHLYLLIIIFIILDQNDFDGICTLTKMEDFFRSKNSVKEEKKQRRPEFFKPLVKKLFNINITRVYLTRLNNFLLMLAFLFGFLRMLCHYKIIRFSILCY